MQRDRWIKLTGLFTIIGAISAVLVVPEFRGFLRLNYKGHIPSLVPTASADAPEVSRPPASAKPSGSLMDGKAGYYVIGYTTDDQAIASHESERQNRNGFHTHVAYSSNWSGFTPGWYIIVYGIYDNKADAVNALRQVEAQGSTAYIKHSGNRIR